MSAFGLVWNILFHSVTFTLLVYWIFTSQLGGHPEQVRHFNDFWMENQLLFGGLCQVSLTLFFREEVISFLKHPQSPLARARTVNSILRGSLFAILMVMGLVVSKQYQFLGFTSAASPNFLSSYAWILRFVLITVFIMAQECFIHAVMFPRLPKNRIRWLPQALAVLTRLGFLSIWFQPSWGELFSLALLLSWFDDFWEQVGFFVAFFSVTHAGFSLPWLGMTFSGLTLVQPFAETGLVMVSDRFLEIIAIQGACLILWIGFKLYNKGARNS